MFLNETSSEILIEPVWRSDQKYILHNLSIHFGNKATSTASNRKCDAETTYLFQLNTYVLIIALLRIRIKIEGDRDQGDWKFVRMSVDKGLYM